MLPEVGWCSHQNIDMDLRVSDVVYTEVVKVCANLGAAIAPRWLGELSVLLCRIV